MLGGHIPMKGQSEIFDVYAGLPIVQMFVKIAR